METEPGRLNRTLARVYLALCILALAAMLTRSIPEHRRQMMRLWLLRWSHRATLRLARHTGAASMGRELSTGDQLYSLPYWLACQAERIAVAYDRERGAV